MLQTDGVYADATSADDDWERCNIEIEHVSSRHHVNKTSRIMYAH